MRELVGKLPRARAQTTLYLLGCMAATESHLVWAQAGSLSEVENMGSWVLNLFSPTLLLVLLTVVLIGCGLAVFFGRMGGSLFVKILIGSILVFGARTIAPKIIGLF